MVWTDKTSFLERRAEFQKILGKEAGESLEAAEVQRIYHNFENEMKMRLKREESKYERDFAVPHHKITEHLKIHGKSDKEMIKKTLPFLYGKGDFEMLIETFPYFLLLLTIWNKKNDTFKLHMLIHTLLLQMIFNLQVNVLVNWINWKSMEQNVLLPSVNGLNCWIKRILILYVARISTLLTWFIWRHRPIKQNILLPSVNGINCCMEHFSVECIDGIQSESWTILGKNKMNNRK